MGGRGRVKRQQVEAHDGWTIITHGLSNLSVSGRKGKGKGQNRNVTQAGSMPSDTVEGLTAEKLLQDFNNRTEKWGTTTCAQHLSNILAKGEWTVSEAVCIGIGSFSRDWEHRHRAIWQLVAFMSIVSHFRKTSSEVKIYAQEPAFTPLDHAFLSLLSVNICTDYIETKITPRSFVYSPFVDWYILLPIFLKGKDPVLYVGNEILDDYGAVAQSEEKKEKLEECNTFGGKWLEKRNTVKLEEFEMHPHALNGMVVYWVQVHQGDGVRAAEEGQEELRETNKAEIENEKHGNETESELHSETSTEQSKTT